jgi:hypothetical protein
MTAAVRLNFFVEIFAPMAETEYDKIIQKNGQLREGYRRNNIFGALIEIVSAKEDIVSVIDIDSTLPKLIVDEHKRYLRLHDSPIVETDLNFMSEAVTTVLNSDKCKSLLNDCKDKQSQCDFKTVHIK